VSSARAILYVGPKVGTCQQRADALRALGHRVEQIQAGPVHAGLRGAYYRIGHRLRRPPDVFGSNAAILAALRREPFDVLWVDKGLSIAPRTLELAREIRPGLARVSYSPDDMASPNLQSVAWLRCVPLYDLHVTTKTFNVTELPALGARDVLFVDNAYASQIHKPLELTPAEHARFACDLGFVGTFESERAQTMLELARAGLRVTIHGQLWEAFEQEHPNLRIVGEHLEGLEYARAVNATKINLGFLRKAYRDRQTTRSVEIPACGAFLLAERTDEHRRLFEEGVEVELFTGFDELLAKARHYLEHEDERRRIAAAGRRRCLESGYSNEHRLAAVLEHLEQGNRAGRDRARLSR
jgi:hypothetical protein